MRLVLAFIALLSIPSLAQPYIYKGAFSQASGSELEACQSLFSETQYGTKFFLLEPGRKAVVYFEHESASAPLNGLSLVGRLGYGNEIQVEKRFEKEGLTYFALAQGLVSHELLLLTLQVTVKDKSGNALCSISADYSGFP